MLGYGAVETPTFGRGKEIHKFNGSQSFRDYGNITAYAYTSILWKNVRIISSFEFV